MSKGHFLCRPPRGTGKPDGVDGDDEPLRLFDDGKWRPDNGRPARAFLGKLGNDNVAFVANCDCPYTDGCPLGVALSKADDLGIEATQVHRRRPIGVGTKADIGATRKKPRKRRKAS